VEFPHAQHSGRSVGFGVRAPQESGPFDQRQAEVAEPAFGRGHIAFHLVVEAEQARQPPALYDKIIERRKDMDLFRRPDGPRRGGRETFEPVINVFRQTFHFELEYFSGFAQLQ